MPPKKAPRKKAANGHKLPDPIPKGEILTDLKKQRWIIDSSIGVGGFGEIYAAAPYKDKKPSEYPAVIKIEPHGNGPLFVEMHFYMRNASPTDIDSWKKEKKLPMLGMPPFLGSGSHEYNDQKYRFIVTERYGTDLWKLFLQNGKMFPEHTVYKVAWQIINVLEYIHHKTYVHADIKGANLLLDLKTQNQVFLVDFGLASRYTTKDEYKLDPKKAHDGTIEYTSRDAHMGVPTMRGDFEILLYNMIHWLGGSLPWDDNLKNPSSVQQQKEKAFNNIQKFLKECFPTSDVPAPITQFMSLLASIKYNETPNYNKFRDILIKGLQKLKHTPTGKLEFSDKKNYPKSISSPKKTKTNIVENKVPTPRKTKTSTVENNVSTPRKTKTNTVEDKVPTPRKTKTNIDEDKGSGKKMKPISSIRSTRAKRNIPLLDESLNSSIDSVVLNEKCISGKDMKQLLENIDGKAEYEVQIKKRKTKASSSNGETPTKPVKRSRRQLVKQEDASITDSEGNKNSIKGEYDSEKDMFEESLDD